MNKLLLCVAILAMGYIASADVATYGLPLNATAFQNGITEYLAHICESPDGKFYYNDIDVNGNPIVQVWEAKTKSQLGAIDAVNVTAQINNFINDLGAGHKVASLLECLGSNVYANYAYSNDTNTGIEVFPVLTGDNTNVTATLPLTDVDLTKSDDTFMVTSCSTTDGKFYYVESDDPKNPTLQVWDSVAKTQGTAVSLNNAVTQKNNFIDSLGDLVRSVTIVQCIGTTVYLNVAYQNDTAAGIQLFVAEDIPVVTNYSLPLASGAAPETAEDYLSNSCQTTNGKFYYADIADDKSYFLQEWDSSNQAIGATTPLTDPYNQVAAFIKTLDPKINSNQVVQCIGNNVFVNVAYGNSTIGGIQLFLIKSSAAGILSFSYVALFLAFVAMLL